MCWIKPCLCDRVFFSCRCAFHYYRLGRWPCRWRPSCCSARRPGGDRRLLRFIWWFFIWFRRWCACICLVYSFWMISWLLIILIWWGVCANTRMGPARKTGPTGKPSKSSRWERWATWPASFVFGQTLI